MRAVALAKPPVHLLHLRKEEEFRALDWTAKPNFTISHFSWSAVVDAGWAPSSAINERTEVFVIIRHPYDRLVSLHFYWRKFGLIPHEMSFGEMVELLAEHWNEIPVPSVRRLSTCRSLRMLPQSSQARLQVEWIDSMPHLNHAFRFEELPLTQSFSELFRLPTSVIASWKRENATPHPSWQSMYDDHLIGLAYELYRVDCERLGYFCPRTVVELLHNQTKQMLR